LSLLKVKTARAQARQKNAEERAEVLNRKIEELELNARARQAQDALREAADAQRRAAEAQRRARELREQAAAERERAQQERSRTEVAEGRIAVAQDRLTELRQSFAELKPRLTDRGLVLTLGEVLFGFDSANLKPYTQRIMERLADFLQTHPKYTQKIEGHTDSVGTATYNLQLSRARAQSVAEALLSRGIARERISVEGFGETRPVASNETETGRRENRRVEVVISQGR